MYRQGDILFVRVAKVAEGSKVVKDDLTSLLVAEGEATGHHHTLHVTQGATITEYEAPTQDEVDRRFIEIMAGNDMIGAKLTHQEHATIDLPAGIYEVRRQREYEPERNRYVAD